MIKSKLQPLYLKSSLESYLLAVFFWSLLTTLYAADVLDLEEPLIDVKLEEESPKEPEPGVSSKTIVRVALITTGVMLLVYTLYCANYYLENPLYQAVSRGSFPIPKIPEIDIVPRSRGTFPEVGENEIPGE